MKNIILKAENISKQYRLGQVGTGTIRHDFNRFWHKVRGKEDPYLKVGAVNDRSSQAKEEYVWALRDINFEVQEGEVLGIIGKNGAGKSTLLKILSRVTSPSTGVIKTKGRIASLLEVGTGFHPELTGLENIFLNGAILGMNRSEITDKLEEIVEFSGCKMYINTPVKRYSSGMRVRLAFAVAAYLEPDILVIDEVLAVGDAEFQKKAIGKMQDISKGDGRTVLFVSHNMAAVKSLCSRAIVLENGITIYEGVTEEAVDFYLKSSSNSKLQNTYYFDQDLFKGKNVVLKKIFIYKECNDNIENISREDSVLFEIQVEKRYSEKIGLALRFKDDNGNYLFVTNNEDLEDGGITGNIIYCMKIPPFFFNEGTFLIDIIVHQHRKLIIEENDVASFIVTREKLALGDWMGKSKGALKPKFKWQIIKC